jgi:hypothetical protein
MKIKRIALDIDDTLNSFTLTAMKFVGCPVDVDDWSTFPHEFGYDILGATNSMRAPDCQFTLSEFWDSFKREFWASRPHSKDFDYLLKLSIDLVGIEDVFFLTSPTYDPDCLAGKADWIYANLPRSMWRQYSITPRKWFNAAPDYLRGDDSDDNVDKWRAECRERFNHPGYAILIPRPWNTRWAESGKNITDEILALTTSDCGV